MSALAYRQLFRALSMIFCGIALVGGSGLWLFSGVIATRWLEVSDLPLSEVALAVQIMAISVALRWMGGLYRGVISGSERLVWLSVLNALIATLRFVAVFATMWFYGFTPYVFFMHQLAIALLEITSLFLISSLLLPSRRSLRQSIGWSIRPVKPFLKFAMTIAFTTSVWVLVTQTDKLILSGILPLTEYGYFTLAVLLASGIMIVSGPISNAIMPRMARLHAEGDHADMLQVYRNATRLVSVIAGSASITIAVSAEQLLFAWTGDIQIAEKAAPILRLYAIGNGLLSIAAFPYYLQYALGDLRYHLIGNVITIILLIPAVIVSAINFGAIGAAYVWLGVNAFNVFVWGAFVHSQLLPGVHTDWLVKDIFVNLSPVLIIGFLVYFFPFELEGREQNLYFLLVVGFSAFISSLIVFSITNKFKFV